MAKEKKIIYFEKTCRENTSDCLEIVKEALKKENYKHVVVASTTGNTGILFSESLKGSGVNLIVVTHSSGFKEPNKHEMPEETRRKIEKNGAEVFTGSMLTHSIETCLASKFGGSYPSL